MPSYLVETYLTRGHAAERDAIELRARSAADELTQQGTEVHLERSIYVPEDEICFFVFDAPVADDAARAARRAGLARLPLPLPWYRASGRNDVAAYELDRFFRKA